MADRSRCSRTGSPRRSSSCVALLVGTRRLRELRAVAADRPRLLAGAAALIALNRGVFIYAISIDRVLEGAAELELVEPT